MGRNINAVSHVGGAWRHAKNLSARVLRNYTSQISPSRMSWSGLDSFEPALDQKRSANFRAPETPPQFFAPEQVALLLPPGGAKSFLVVRL